MKQKIILSIFLLILLFIILIPKETVAISSIDGDREEYLVGTSDFNLKIILEIGISISFIIVAFGVWNRYGKDKMVVDTVEFYPPDGLNSVELAYIYKGNCEMMDVITLLIYLANKGYIKIEEYEEENLKKVKSKKIKIIKTKEYDGDNENEKVFLTDLFEQKDEVTVDESIGKFYLILKKTVKNLNSKKNKEKIFEKASLGLRTLIMAMIIIIFIFMGGLSLLNIEEGKGLTIFIFIFFLPLFLLYENPEVLMIVAASISSIFINFFCIIMNGFFLDRILLIKLIIENICMILLIVFLGIIKKRTQYGIEMLGRIKGFKNFLEISEMPQLAEMVDKDSEYFYNILPYIYALGISSKFIKKIEGISLKEPSWYCKCTSSDNISTIRAIDSAYMSIVSPMSTNPSDNSGYGGGFSGGGSGGSW